MRYAQLVIGPAGSGKSTYCSALVQHGVDVKRNIEVINLDPAAEHFDYEPLVDIRELIHVQDTMEDEELHFGPNGDVELSGNTAFNEKHRKLTEAIGKLIEDYSLVRFIPLNLKDHENIGDVLLTIDNVIQFGEDQDIKTKDFEEADDDKD
ncbi:hypothetical protein NQ314_006224 [Rhamnusium bicolor]|uniref:GPN-loop GTPase 3 n=1 Tax=Rhamnusium bicolor TaxID=1586634 RepID=A0AAV8Z8K2_9CUCU|nr:hypothetical protein NQ314_006224 [Rhamnusium bicolor]